MTQVPRMPRWQSYVATTTNPIFTPEQCKTIIDAGHQCAPEQAKVGGGEDGKYDTKKRVTTISWIPFNKLPQMYKVIENQLSIVNLNHFYFSFKRWPSKPHHQRFSYTFLNRCNFVS